ncbi:helix-turn-helix domain-containing protein (plasmid) [Natrinema zhouii]|uniref:HTH domain-containing protein n=1 Tax=Natrinema zhouii TaxID=1710539 RepID=UPI001CFFDC82|nr:HTH domain-containing protein [Natrinema zhouii]UHQ98659.1 helix-turn-helix domain-containing protein [Natrinema zhouii]
MSKPGPAPEVTTDDVLNVFAERDDTAEPLTAPEIAEHLGCTRRTVQKRLNELEEQGAITRKKVGGRAVVWWPSSDKDAEDTPDFEAGYGALAGSNFADEVEAVGDELDRDFRESERELFADDDA